MTGDDNDLPVGRPDDSGADSSRVALTVNGEPREVRAGATVADLLTDLGLAAGPVAVERNRGVVRRADHGTTGLEAGDQLEIVTFLGGG